jgi:hypothetical protein
LSPSTQMHRAPTSTTPMHRAQSSTDVQSNAALACLKHAARRAGQQHKALSLEQVISFCNTKNHTAFTLQSRQSMHSWLNVVVFSARGKGERCEHHMALSHTPQAKCTHKALAVDEARAHTT